MNLIYYGNSVKRTYTPREEPAEMRQINRRGSIEDVFRAALTEIVDESPRGFQKDLARRAGISASYLNDLLRGRAYGTEENRRKIADAINMEYEDLLDRGRRLLGLVKEKRDDTIIPLRDQLDRLIVSNLFSLNEEDKITVLRLILRFSSKRPEEISSVINELKSMPSMG
jgi:transcriptional regulator with XRE-family HTH domain